MTEYLWHYKYRHMAHYKYILDSESNKKMKILYLFFSVLLLVLLQGPGAARSEITTHGECGYVGGACYSFICPRGTITIGKCSFTLKCCRR
ncbi:gallinacin-4-like [Sceloporus undulatus]|uniref:gallinacin-4-like n=1 Tax=Sceloporus undulatus TaxID=8520 RepID=UPI001C4BBB3A|nr:gallinacin-4-like [Sceloporus undulatus]